MYTAPSLLAGLGALASLASAQCAPAVAAANKCPITFDARIPKNFTAQQFDADGGPFQSKNVLGKGLAFSTEVKLLPNLTASSLFDAPGQTQPFSATIRNESIFAPSATNIQVGFRRIDLLAASNNGTDPSSIGVKTLHFSMMKDPARPLNLSHEYQLVFMEDAKFTNNQFNVRTGLLLDIPGADPKNITVFGNSNDFKSLPAPLFGTAFTDGVMHNFALTLDFDKNTTQVFYSTGTQPLVGVTAPIPNPLGGRGQFHFSVLKKPTDGGADVPHNGFQEAPINEGMIYAGLFMEDSATGCMSLSP